MSYLIQNSLFPNKSTKITLRIRASFLARNVAVIFTLLNASTKSFSLSYPLTKHNLHFSLNSSYLFTKFAKILFVTPKAFRYTPLGVNFPTSAQYRALWNINYLISSDTVFMPFPDLTDSVYKYPYYTKTQVAITPVTKRPFSLALHKLLRMNLALWFFWPRAFKLNSNFTDINMSWVWVRFLNKYFFKVYTL